MRILFKALLAATALIPVATAATAQDGPERWRNNRGGAAEAKMEGRDEALGADTSAPQVQSRAQVQVQPRQRWDGNRDDTARAEAGAEFRRQPRAPGQSEQRRWDSRAEARPVPQANVAVNRSGGTDWNNPRADRGRAGDRRTWNDGQASAPLREARRDDRRFDARSSVTSQGRDDRGWNGRGDRGQFGRDSRNGWNQGGRDSRFGDNGWNQPGRNDRFQNGGNWSRSWRNDRRYDWNGYRANNRYAYRLPRYYAPSGWGYGYRRFSIGAMLNSILWNEDYWIEDPYSYRLPEAYGPYRWVRYYDDALLVDLRSGQVVDVVNGIFW